MFVDLISKLSEDDKKRIENYIHLYGTADNFIGLDKWLQNWSHSNQKLFQLLGGQLIVKKELKIEKPSDMMKRQFDDLLESCKFIDDLDSTRSIYDNSRHMGYYELRSSDPFYTGNLWDVMHECCFENADVYLRDKVEHGAKAIGPCTGKTYQIPQGMKPIRALKKIVEYFQNELPDAKESCVTNLNKYYEDFQIAASMILNDKILRGNLCISIHPLDYMTMSDNSLNWSSCMSWVSDGCYRVGTVEMMNSNNTLCCYLEGETPFCFNKEAVKISSSSNYEQYNRELSKKMKEASDKAGELYHWNNKKWRVLAYVNKDIAMTGKSYPYYSESMDKNLLAFITELAAKNVNWHYQFGPERYKDMIHVYTATAMSNNKRWIKYGRTTKHNILWDTKGMYNDMLNANNYKYWCYRNPVKHNKIYSVSGKSPCLCCGDQVTKLEWPDDRDYNSRYDHTGAVICKNCIDKLYYCDCCESRNTTVKHIYVEINGEVSCYCEKCAQSLFCYCPCCGAPMFVLPSVTYSENRMMYPMWLPKQNKDLYRYPSLPQRGLCLSDQSRTLTKDREADEEDGCEYAQLLFMCTDCLQKYKNKWNFKRETHVFYSGWVFSKEKYAVGVIHKDDKTDDYNEFCYRRLRHVPMEELKAGTEVSPFKATSVGIFSKSEISDLPSDEGLIKAWRTDLIF